MHRALSLLAFASLLACSVSPPADWTTTELETRSVALDGRSFTVRVPSRLTADSVSDEQLGTLSLSAGTMSGPHVGYRITKDLVPPKTLDEAGEHALSVAPQGTLKLVKKTAYRGGFLVHASGETSALVTIHFPLKGGRTYQCIADYMTPGLFADTKTKLTDAEAAKYLVWLEGLCTPRDLSDR